MYNLHYYAPTSSTLCAYLHFLTTRYNNPSTILNYFGGLNSSLARMGIDTSPFGAIDVLDFVQSIKTNIRHVPQRKTYSFSSNVGLDDRLFASGLRRPFPRFCGHHNVLLILEAVQCVPPATNLLMIPLVI